MKKLVISLVCILTLTACASILRDDHLASKISEVEDEPLVLSDLTDYKWDSVYIAGPYTQFDYMRIKKIPLSMRIRTLDMGVGEFESVLLFKSKGKLVKYAFIPRSVYNFDGFCIGMAANDTISSTICQADIKRFYKAYMTNVLNDSISQNTALCQQYMTEAMRAKVARQAKVADTDPIIRTQTMTQDAIESLEVESKRGVLYQVSYQSNKADTSTVMNIPLCAIKVHGQCRIVYITPPANGTQGRGGWSPERLRGLDYGIDQSSAAAFIRSFYVAYSWIYYDRPLTLSEELAEMRTRHLSAKALAQFAQAEAAHREDGHSGYDLLINQYDFDPMWAPIFPLSTDFDNPENDTFTVSYKLGETKCEFTVTVKKEGDKYVIDGVKM